MRLTADLVLFHDADQAAYADFQVKGHRETYPIRSAVFERMLRGLYYRATAGAPTDAAFKKALNVIEARAINDGPRHEVFLRVAGHDGKIYLNLADEHWRVVEIDSGGWRLCENAPVRFIRRKGMRALSVPRRQGGSIRRLRKFLNLKSDEDFVLVVAWLLAALRDRGPYPVLDVTGEQGTAKSTMITVLRNLVDPNLAQLCAPPRDERDVFIAARNGHVLSYDNLSYLPAWMSDAFSRISTGGGFATRRLYSDDEQQLFDAKRPILLGGITEVVGRGDLADRCIRVQLEPIPDDKRRREREFEHAFEQDHPGILGALLDGIAHGLRKLPHVRLDKASRMADFEEWGIACEGAFWEAGTFIRAYRRNRSSMSRAVVDADMVASALRQFMARHQSWTGTTTELLIGLERVVGEHGRQRKGWPAAPNKLSEDLKRVAPALREQGIHIDQGQREPNRTRNRTITITRQERG